MIDTPKPKSAVINVGAQKVASMYAQAFLGAAQATGKSAELVEHNGQCSQDVAAIITAFCDCNRGNRQPFCPHFIARSATEPRSCSAS